MMDELKVKQSIQSEYKTRMSDDVDDASRQ